MNENTRYITQNLQPNSKIDIPHNIEKFKLTHEVSEQDMQDKNLILIRTALSQQSIDREFVNQQLQNNKDTLSQQEQQDLQDEIQRIKTSQIYIDSPLSDFGIQQAIHCQEQVNNLDIHTVYISPLLRSLQTAYYIFEQHPNRQKIQFKVMPAVSDLMRSSSSVSHDANTELRDVFEKAKFDFSQFNNYQIPSLWQILQLEDEELVKQLSQLFWQEDKEALSKVLVKQMQRLYPQQLENYKIGYQRAKKFKEQLQHYKSNNNIKQAQKICIISHQSFLKCLTANEINQEGTVDGPDFNYCQLVPINL